MKNRNWVLVATSANTLIAQVVERTPGATLMMGAYGHSTSRMLIVGSTTAAMMHTVHVAVLLVW